MFSRRLRFTHHLKEKFDTFPYFDKILPQESHLTSKVIFISVKSPIVYSYKIIELTES